MSFLFGNGAKATQAPVAIGALNIQQSSYGTPIQIIYGTNRAAGNLIWYGDFNSVQQSQNAGGGKGGVGGGGGKGGGSGTFQYYASLMIGLCEGTITGINQVFVSKQTTDLPTLGGVVSTGVLNQLPWGYLSSNHPDEALGYSNLAHVDFANFSLGTSPETPQFSFEVEGILIYGNGIQDAAPEQVVIDFLQRAGFPTALIDSSMTLFANYCRAMGFFISPVVDQQRSAIDWLNEWVSGTLNSVFIWSNGVLSIVPYGDAVVTGNGVTYTPNLTPVYNISDDDYIVSGDEDPVTIAIKDMIDAYNQQPIEYTNRANQYNVETFTAEDQGQIDLYGYRTAPTIQAHHVTDPNVAQVMAYLNLWRQIYVDHGRQFTFKLPWNFILLDPMDLITITDANLGLNNTLVRISAIDEDQDGLLTFTCEEMPGDVAAPALYNSQTLNRHIPNYNQEPGSINVPVIFEAPLALVQQSAIELDIAVSGSNPVWGGCDVWASNDGEKYQMIGQVNGGARQGFLTNNLPSFTPMVGGNNIDETSTLSVDLSESTGVLSNSATNSDAVNLNTLCYVDGELISYGEDTLVTQYNYNLTYLNRGCYGTPISAHNTGSQFARIDQSIIREPIDQTRIGQTIYFKFPSFNVWGGGVEELSDVPAYPYQILGTALLTPLDNPTDLSVLYTGNIAQLSWSPISDIRSTIFYEIRQGTSFANSQVVGRTTQTTFPVYGTGTYWISALYFTPLEVAVYSSSPPSIAVATPSIVQNSLGSHTEETAWTGSKTNTEVSGGNLQLADSLDVLATSNILVTPNILGGAAIAGSGSYHVDPTHIITSEYIAPLKVIVNWTVEGVSLTDNILTEPDVLSLTDILGAAYQAKVSANPQIRLSQTGGSSWGDWMNWVPGYYIGNAVDFQILLATTDGTINCVLSDYSFEVDIDDRTDTGTIATSASVLVSVAYPVQYNQAPIPQITIQNQQAGDDVILSSISATGFQVEVVNGGVKVVRTVGWSVTTY